MSRVILESGQGFGGSGQPNHHHPHHHPSQPRQRLWHHGTVLPSLGRVTGAVAVEREEASREDGGGRGHHQQNVSSDHGGVVGITTLPRLEVMHRTRNLNRETDYGFSTRMPNGRGNNEISGHHRNTKSWRNSTWAQQKSRSLKENHSEFEHEGLEYWSRSRRNSIKRPVDDEFKPKTRDFYNEHKRRGTQTEEGHRKESQGSNPRSRGLRTVAQLTREGTVEDFHRVDLGSSYRVISGKERKESSQNGAVSLPPLKHIPPRSPETHHKRRRVEICLIPDTIEFTEQRISIAVDPPPKPLRSILKNARRNLENGPRVYLNRDTNAPSDSKLRLPSVSRTSSGMSNSSFLQVPSPQPRPKTESVLGFSCSKEFEAVFRNMDMEVEDGV